ncbi:MAG TPA: helix-turn-helix domain-containing protein, partial [Chitinophagaceae bacterium]
MDTKERIQNKAEELFMQFGIRSVSMDDIANNLGMSKKTVYQYFVDKDELVEAVVQAHI